jgi:hypothetical protein
MSEKVDKNISPQEKREEIVESNAGNPETQNSITTRRRSYPYQASFIGKRPKRQPSKQYYYVTFYLITNNLIMTNNCFFFISDRLDRAFKLKPSVLYEDANTNNNTTMKCKETEFTVIYY